MATMKSSKSGMRPGNHLWGRHMLKSGEIGTAKPRKNRRLARARALPVTLRPVAGEHIFVGALVHAPHGVGAAKAANRTWITSGPLPDAGVVGVRLRICRPDRGGAFAGLQNGEGESYAAGAGARRISARRAGGRPDETKNPGAFAPGSEAFEILFLKSRARKARSREIRRRGSCADDRGTGPTAT